MRRLHKLARLSSSDRRLLVRAALLVAAVRLGLWILPFRTLQRVLARVSDPVRGCAPQVGLRPTPSLGPPSSQSPETIAWAVTAASRYVPRATCLTQALVAHVLLQQRGYPAELRLGVRKDTTGRFAAHAWLESGGQVVIGGTGHEHYTPLPTWRVGRA